MNARASRSQADLKYHNLKLIYSLIRDEGPLSRVTLSRRTGLSATSMTRIIGTLTELGLVCEHSVAPASGMGRPATLLDIRPEAAYCLCVDTMINRCKVTLTDLRGKFAAYRELSVPPGTVFPAFAEAIAAIVPQLAREAGVPRQKILCCGMSLTAHVLAQTGYVVASSQFQWYDIDARAILENRLHMPVYLENDCKSALLGEEYLLRKEGSRVENIAYMEFGWGGVGSAAIVDGRLVRGSRNAAGEIGHFTADPQGEMCNCGHTGCFETMISEQAVIRKAQGIDPSFRSVEQICQGLEQGNQPLWDLIDHVGETIAIAVNDLSCAYNPEVVLLNGALILGCGACYDSVKKHLEVRLLESIQPELRVEAARMGTNASLYGIGCIAVERAVSALLQSGEAQLELP